MNKLKFLLSLSLTIYVLISLPILSLASNQVQLDNNVYIAAECVNNEITLTLTNNSNKNISAVGVFIALYDENNNMIDNPFEISALKAKSGETKSVNQSLYVQTSVAKIGVYPCEIRYDDWTAWGSQKENFDSAVSLGYGFNIDNEINNSIEKASSNNGSAIFYGFLFIVLILVAFILIKILKRKTKNEEPVVVSPIQPTPVINNTVSPEAKGIEGESRIHKDILAYIPGEKRIVKNAYITKSDGRTTEIDIIFIHTSGIYVIESKNYSGWIFGNEADKKWTQSIFNVATKQTEKYQFYNPIQQNQNHVKFLKSFLGNIANNIPFYSVVIFGEKADLKNITITSQNSVAIKEEDLLKAINGYIAIAETSKKIIPDQDIQSIFEKLRPLSQVSEETKQKHIDEIKKMS